jgi:hypothetical protein
MATSVDKARAFVYGNGVLWEQALFGYLFDGRPLDHLHRCWLAYTNPDGGWGHDLEHDIKCPDSHPLALEFLLSIGRDTGVPLDGLLDGTITWLESHRNMDGSLANPPTLRDYPLALWWTESGGQSAPDSITGNLIGLGICSESLANSTARWVQAHLGLEQIRANGWLFMAYHAFDYFMNVQDYPDLEAHRQATIQNIAACAAAAPEGQYNVVFQFAPAPDSPVARALPADVLRRCLDYLEDTQQADGCWQEEHGIARWSSYTTIRVLLALKRYGRLAV